MIRPLLLCLTVVATPLGACNDSKDGTTISFNATGDDGNMVAGVDGTTGKVSLDVPGFSGKLSLPKIHLDAGDFDMNGVHLYPGSTISTMNIDAHDGKGKDDDSGTVHVGFASPATPAQVRDWFNERLTKTGFTLKAEGNGLTGTTDEGKPFRLDLIPDGADHAKGTITVSG